VQNQETQIEKRYKTNSKNNTKTSIEKSDFLQLVMKQQLFYL